MSSGIRAVIDKMEDVVLSCINTSSSISHNKTVIPDEKNFWCPCEPPTQHFDLFVGTDFHFHYWQLWDTIAGYNIAI